MPRKLTVRKCSHCDRPAKLSIINGRNKGWLKTCGRLACRKARHRLGIVNLEIPKRQQRGICELCSKPFTRWNWGQRWCPRCVPTPAWRHRARRYGVGKVQWCALLKKQGGTCALCKNKPAVVDHDHKDGSVRGLLCRSCNTALATLDREIQWHRRAELYILKRGG